MGGQISLIMSWTGMDKTDGSIGAAYTEKICKSIARGKSIILVKAIPKLL
jgi:hypothetical protein